MNGPKFRFTIVVSFLVISVWLYLVISTYLFGESGLNFARYGANIAALASAAGCGFFLVWVALRGMEWAVKRQKTGFEGEFTDEYGTKFMMRSSDGKPAPFAFSLSKFLPQLIAPPIGNPDMHPLEAEVIGFLNGYRHWPHDLERQDINLYQASLAQWEAMRSLKGTTWVHRVAALSQYLGKVHAYKEERTIYPVSQWWKRDRVRFSSRCREHAGLAGVVLATMPHFRNLAADPKENTRLRTVILTALKHRLDPMNLPLNADPLARELVDMLHHANAVAKKTILGDITTVHADENLKQDLVKHLGAYIPALVDELKLGTTPHAPDTDAVLLPGGIIALEQKTLIGQAARILTPALRDGLHLWENGAGAQHPAWPVLSEALTKLGVLKAEHENVPAYHGAFCLHLEEVTWDNACLLQYDALRYPGVSQRILAQPTWQGAWFVTPHPDLAVQTMVLHAAALDDRLAALVQ